MKKLLFILLVLGGVLSAEAFSPLHRITVTPALLAQGGSAVAAFNDEASSEANPAGLAELDYDGFSLGGRRWIFSSFIFSAAGCGRLPLPFDNGVGVRAAYLGIDKEYQIQYKKNGLLSDYELQLGGFIAGLAYGMKLPLPLPLSVGLSVDFFQYKQGSGLDKILGVTASLGAIYRIIATSVMDLQAGLNARNTISGGYVGKYDIGIGMYMSKGFGLALSGEIDTGGPVYLNAGLEYRIKGEASMLVPRVSYRQGLMNSRGGSINAGLEFRIAGFKFDAAVSYVHNLAEFTAGGGVAYIIQEHKDGE